jgi:hypothetical protein
VLDVRVVLEPVRAPEDDRFGAERRGPRDSAAVTLPRPGAGVEREADRRVAAGERRAVTVDPEHDVALRRPDERRRRVRCAECARQEAASRRGSLLLRAGELAEEQQRGETCGGDRDEDRAGHAEASGLSRTLSEPPQSIEPRQTSPFVRAHVCALTHESAFPGGLL